MNLPFTGGCVCGAVRYEVSAAPLMMFKCHCRDCQHVTGGGFVPGMLVPATAFRLTKGEVKYHFTPSMAGGKHKRGFCAECGSPVVTQFDAAPERIGIHAASLDDPSWFRPALDVWTSDAQPWDYMNPDLPGFERYPQKGKGGNDAVVS